MRISCKKKQQQQIIKNWFCHELINKIKISAKICNKKKENIYLYLRIIIVNIYYYLNPKMTNITNIEIFFLNPLNLENKSRVEGERISKKKLEYTFMFDSEKKYSSLIFV